jgi:hypothetical protein
MTKACFVLLADTDTHEAMGRMANALTSAKEFVDAGDDVAVVFDGAGTKWVPELASEDRRYHRSTRSLSNASPAHAVLRPGVRRKSQDRGQQREATDRLPRPPKPATFVSDGYQVITF